MADLVNAVLEFLKLNGTISDLEKDILDTADKLFKQPFSREDVQKKVGENYQKHYDIIVSAGLVLGGNFMLDESIDKTVRKRKRRIKETRWARLDKRLLRTLQYFAARLASGCSVKIPHHSSCSRPFLSKSNFYVALLTTAVPGVSKPEQAG